MTSAFEQALADLVEFGWVICDSWHSAHEVWSLAVARGIPAEYLSLLPATGDRYRVELAPEYYQRLLSAPRPPADAPRTGASLGLVWRDGNRPQPVCHVRLAPPQLIQVLQAVARGSGVVLTFPIPPAEVRELALRLALGAADGGVGHGRAQGA